MSKKRILLVNEFHQLSTGYATYFKHILPYLYNTGEFEIAELAVFLSPGHPQKDQWLSQTPWKVYMNEPPANAPVEAHQAYRSDPLNQLGKFRLDEVLLDFKPDFCCVPPGTPVFSEYGYRPIDEIKVGDKVLTHKGRFKKVTKTMRRQHEGKMVKIFVAGTPDPIRLTPEHPVLIYPYEKINNGSRCLFYKDIEPTWVEAQDVKEHDIVLLNPIKNTSVDNTINTTDYLKQFFINNNTVYPNNRADKGIPTVISINQEFGRLIGYIIGDGHITETGNLNIAFGGEEQEFADDAAYLLKKYFQLESKIKHAVDRHMISVFCNCSILGQFLKEFLGYRTNDKYIPHCFFNSTKDSKEGVLQGLVRSDGCYKHNTISLCTINKKLASDYRILCASVGIAVTIVFNKNSGKNGSYEINAYGLNAYNLHKIVKKFENSIETTENLTGTVRRASTLSFINNFIGATVRRVRKENYVGQVYNLSVEEDESYTLSHIVHNCTIRDPYVDAFIDHTPYRGYFQHIHMPTIDSEPLKQEWIEQYAKANVLLAYSYFGKRVLEQQSGGKLKVAAVASPGADTQNFKPMDKAALRAKMGIKDDAFIIQTVMRNQPRKLFPELFKAFATFLKKCEDEGNIDLAARSYLHVHTTFPDLGWNLSNEIRQHKLSHKVVWTYMCDACKRHEVNFFRDSGTVCPHCHAPAYHLPNTAIGVTREQLCELMNIADVYVQYASCIPTNTEIKTINDGWKPVWKIQEGEFVQTHDGTYHPVLAITKTNLGNRNMHEISFRGDVNSLQLTEEHPVLALTKEKVCPNYRRSLREFIGDCLRAGKELPEPQWVPSNELQKNDLVVSLINTEVLDIEKIDLAEFADPTDVISDTEIKLKYGDTYPRFIEVNNDFCQFLGLFAADGSAGVHRSGLQISCHIDEKDNHDLCDRIIRKITNKKPHIYYPKNKKAVDYRFDCRILKTAFTQWFKQKEHKQLPVWTEKLPLHKQKALLHGMFMGDGYFSKNKKSGKYSTISRRLYEQLKNLLERQKINYSVCMHHRQDRWSQKRLPQYYFEMPGDIKHGELVSRRINTGSLYYGNYYFKKVKENKIVDCKDQLFNLEVGVNHSYVTKNGVLHNCEGWGLPISDAKSCGIPVIVTDYSALAEQGHSPGGLACPPDNFGQEPYTTSTGQIRVVKLDHDVLVKQLYDLATIPGMAKEIGEAGRKLMEQVYDWSKIARIWQSVIEETKPLDRNLTWYGPPRIISGSVELNQKGTNQEFVRECFAKILQQNPDNNQNEINRLTNLLNQGFENGRDMHGREFRQPINRQVIAQRFADELRKRNQADERRLVSVFGYIQENNAIQTIQL